MRRKPRRSIPKLRPEALDERLLLGTLIAEIDTGVDLNSQVDSPYYDLTYAYNAYTQQAATSDGSNIADNSLGQGHGHGSTVADSIVQGIQATTSQPGAAGADVKILPIRVTSDSGQEDGNTFNAVLRGIFYAAYHHASVVNLSIVFLETGDHAGYVPNNPDPSYTNQFPTFQNAIDYARSKGTIVVTGAGNNHYDIDSTDSTANGYLPYHLFPTYNLASNLIVAASTDSSGALTSVSNFGSTHVTIGSPAIQNATSYAAGYVSGVAGALAALDPGLSADQLANLVETTAQVYPQLQGIVSTSAVVSPANAVTAVFAPKVASPATASPAAVTGTSTTLSILGSSLLGESALSYTWTTLSGPAVTFTPAGANGTNAAKNLTASFRQPGQYVFEVKISGGSGRTVTSDVTVSVTSTATTMGIAPTGAPVPDGKSQTFVATAYDQFGLPLSSQPQVVWSVQPGGIGGTVDGSGKYTAPAAGAGEDTVLAISGSLRGTAAVSVGTLLSAPLSISSGSSVAVGSFQADTDVSGGTTDVTTSPVDTTGVVNAAPEAVYQSERWSGDQFSYTIPGLSPGSSYTVRLHFAENFYNAVGQRRFNVAINGATVLSCFDILSVAGGPHKALVESFAATADSQGRIRVLFTNLFGGASCSGIEIIPDSVIVPSSLPLPSAVSLGQDGHDLANAVGSPKPTAGPDGFQDVHLVLSNLAPTLPIDHVRVDRVGGGGLYLSDGTPWSWTSVISRATAGPGRFSDTADLFFQPNPYGVDNNALYQLDVFYVGQSQSVTTFLFVTDSAKLPMKPPVVSPPPSVVSLGQDGHDLANAIGSPSPGPGPDGFQDVHLVLSNLPTATALDHVEVNRVGGGGLYLSDGTPWSWTSVLAQASWGSGRVSDTADVYFQPDPNLVQDHAFYQLDLYFVGQDQPVSLFVQVTDDPKLRKAAGSTS